MQNIERPIDIVAGRASPGCDQGLTHIDQGSMQLLDRAAGPQARRVLAYNLIQGGSRQVTISQGPGVDAEAHAAPASPEPKPKEAVTRRDKDMVGDP